MLKHGYINIPGADHNMTSPWQFSVIHKDPKINSWGRGRGVAAAIFKTLKKQRVGGCPLIE